MAHLPPIDEAALLAKGLTKEQVHELKLKRAHAEFHAKHNGHKAMHAEMYVPRDVTVAGRVAFGA